jgi:hypothetical protein
MNTFRDPKASRRGVCVVAVAMTATLPDGVPSAEEHAPGTISQIRFDPIAGTGTLNVDSISVSNVAY